jgi:hypothetical protein
MRGAWRAEAVASLAVSVALAGCGDASAKHGEAAKSPRQIAADVVAATKQLHSFRMAGTITEAGVTTRVSGAVAGPGQISFSAQHGAESVQVITLGSVTYMKGTRAYYAAQSRLTAGQVTSYAGRWLKLSTTANPSFARSITRTTNISIELRCWAARDRGLSVAGEGRVAGRAAVIVASDGSVPGQAPGEVYVATAGPAWPLRSVITGPRKPGGSGACAQPTTPRSSDFTISDFNRPITLKAPPSPLDLTR